MLGGERPHGASSEGGREPVLQGGATITLYETFAVM